MVTSTILETLALQHGEKPALVFENKVFGFSQIKQQIDDASRRLFNSGLRARDSICILTENRPEFIWCWLGAAQLGINTFLINARLSDSEIVSLMKFSRPNSIFFSPKSGSRNFVPIVETLVREGIPDASARRPVNFVSFDAGVPDTGGFPSWDSFTPRAAGSLPYDQDANSAILTVYSSGTTGEPKGIMLNHQIWRKAYDGGVRLALSAADVSYLPVPLYGIMGLLTGLLTQWSHGCLVVLERGFDAELAAAQIARHKASVFHILPKMAFDLVKASKFDRARPSLRTGVALSNSESFITFAATDLGLSEVVSSYGLTETSGFLTRTSAHDPLPIRARTQGLPLPGVELKIIDRASGETLPPNEIGEILAQGYCVMNGYFNNAAKTAEVIRGNWLYTGDSGFIDEDGRLTYKARLSDSYKFNGFIVFCSEVEEALRQHPDVRDVAVVPFPDMRAGQIGVCFYVEKRPAPNLGATLASFLDGKIARYKFPKKFIPLAELPTTTATGKVKKQLLFSTYEKSIASDAEIQNR